MKGQLLLRSGHLLLSGRVLLRVLLLDSTWQIHGPGSQVVHRVAGVCCGNMIC